MRLGILGSTKGSDIVHIAEAIRSGFLNASIETIITNNKNALILEKAKIYGINSCFINHKNKTREAFDKEITEKLKEKNVDLILLIGFMRILSKEFVSSWKGKIINVHPSLLPKYAGGMSSDVHQRVLDAKDKETGCTIHVVTKDVDKGPVLIQKKCPVFRHDTVASLKKRVQKLEGEAFVEAIKKIGLSNE